MYELTKTGEEDLRQWLCLPLLAKDQRSAELVQIFFSGGISDDAVLANLKKRSFFWDIPVGGFDSVTGNATFLDVAPD